MVTAAQRGDGRPFHGRAGFPTMREVARSNTGRTGHAGLAGGGMVGRDAERGLLRIALADASAGKAVAVELVGEAGIGKTTLLGDLREFAKSRGATVLSGRASEFERDVPYGALLEALDGLPHGLGELADPALRHVTHRAIAELLAQQAAVRPLLLIVDDVHWADPATVALLGALLERPPGGPVLLVLAYRPHQAASSLTPAVTRAAASGRIRRVAVGPLAVADAELLLGGSVARRDVAALHQSCGGNPFQLEQLGRAGIAAGAFVGDRVGAGALPDAVRASLASELDPLSGEARRLLDAAAIAGDPFDVDLAAAISALSEPAHVAALDELVGADVVRPTDAPRVFAFRHPLVRHAVYEAAGPSWRLAAHGRAAAILSEAGAGPIALAHHVEQSASVGDEEAITLLTTAGTWVAPRSPAGAARLLDAAWRLVPEAEQLTAPRAPLLQALATWKTVSGRATQALALTEGLLAELPPGDPLRWMLEVGSATIEVVLGRYGAARIRLRRELERLGPEPSLQRMTTALALGRLAAVLGDTAEAGRVVAVALEAADGLGQPALRSLAMPTVAWIAWLSDDFAAAGRALDEAGPAFDELEVPMLALTLEASSALVRSEWAMGRYEDARRHGLRSLAVARDGSDPIIAVQLLAAQAHVHAALGNLREAQAAAAAAHEEAALLDNVEATFWAAVAEARAWEPTTDAQRAVDAAGRAVELGREQGLPRLVAFAGQAWAAALLAADLPLRAIQAVDDTHGRPGDPELPTGLRAGSHALLAEAELRRGDVAAASRSASRARAASEVDGLPLSAAHACAAEAAVLLAQDQTQEAARRATQGALLARSIGAQLDAARIELIAGRALIAAGDRVAAADLLRQVEAACLASGADRLQAEAVRHLRSIGRRVTRSGRAEGDAVREPLTARQREIAELAAAGRSNREIAETLFLSPKTVETHLAAAYVKLGVRSRRELAAIPGGPAGYGVGT